MQATKDDKHLSKADRQVVQDEADAEQREHRGDPTPPPPPTPRDGPAPLGVLGARVVATLTPRGAKFASNSTDDGATVKVTKAEARVLLAQGMIAAGSELTFSLSPQTGVDLTPITISGIGFGTQGANSQVTVGGVVAPIVTWSATSVTVTATKGASALDTALPVVIRNQAMQTATVGNFVFTAAAGGGVEATVSPTDGVNGTVVTLTGPGGFEAQGANSRVTIGGIVQTITGWTPTLITVTAVKGTNIVGVPMMVGVRVQSMATGYAPQQFTFTA